MTYSRRIGLAPIWITLAIALAIVLAVGLARPRPAGAAIHEIIAALCNGGAGQGEFGEVEPPGQVKQGQSFLRALQATGFITSVVPDGDDLTINFDPTVPNSKFRDKGEGPITFPFGGGFLTLNPNIEPDPDFPAHKNCAGFPPGP